MIRRAVLIGIALAALAPLLFATATEEQSSGQEEANLRFVIWDEHQLAMQEQLASEFMAMNPHITIDIDVIPWADYWTAVQTAVAGGDAHDVLWMNGSNLALFASNGILLPISDLVDRDGYDLSAYPQSLIDLYTYDGMLYGLSKDFDTIGLYYNVEMFDAAGLDYPDDTWTWDDLKNAARVLTTDDVWGFAATLWAQMVVFDLIGQNGGQVLSDDGMHVLYGTPEACEALQFLYSFHEEGISPDQVTLDTTNQWDLFSSQRVAMMYEGSWMARGVVGPGIPGQRRAAAGWQAALQYHSRPRLRHSGWHRTSGASLGVRQVSRLGRGARHTILDGGRDFEPRGDSAALGGQLRRRDGGSSAFGRGAVRQAVPVGTGASGMGGRSEAGPP